MKITMTITPTFDNEIQFFDACKGAAYKLEDLAARALKDGSIDAVIGPHEVTADNDDDEVVGEIIVSE